MREAVAIGKGKVKFEASGGVNLRNVRQIAATGVGTSIGALTHSARAIDFPSSSLISRLDPAFEMDFTDRLNARRTQQFVRQGASSEAASSFWNQARSTRIDFLRRMLTPELPAGLALFLPRSRLPGVTRQPISNT